MSNSYSLWSDEPATQDLLSFKAIASTVVDTLFDDGLNPVALCLSGSWGSGKTSVLELIKADIIARESELGKALVITSQPWSYDPSLGVKEKLISEVLDKVKSEIEKKPTDVAKETLQNLRNRVNWSKVVKMAATTAFTMQLPSISEVFSLTKDGESKSALSPEYDMDMFRSEFGKLIKTDSFEDISRIIVLVDDLDRCLPRTVVETLEAIKLFLSVEGMSFVLAADEDRVAEAIQQEFGQSDDQVINGETVSRLYLHKIVQTTIPLPGLSRFDTQAFLFLLFAKSECDDARYKSLVEECDRMRLAGKSLEELELGESDVLQKLLVTAGRLTPILYEKFKGNPRRIKRFLNDLYVRQSIAEKRGIQLEVDAIAKLMVLEKLMEKEFKRVIGWLAEGTLRINMAALDNKRPSESSMTENDEPETGHKDKHPLEKDPPESIGEMSDELIRWAKLPPSLDSTVISGYLYLAASFAKIPVVDMDIPERIKDIAIAMSSSSALDRKSVDDAAIGALSLTDAQALSKFLVKQIINQPSSQDYIMESIIRIATIHPDALDKILNKLAELPATEVNPSTVIALSTLDSQSCNHLYEKWRNNSSSSQLTRAIEASMERIGDPVGN